MRSPARIFAIALAYSAIVNNRPYAVVARSGSEAVELIVAQSGQYFDPEVVRK